MLVYCIIRNLLFIEKLTTSLKSCKFDIKKKESTVHETLPIPQKKSCVKK